MKLPEKPPKQNVHELFAREPGKILTETLDAAAKVNAEYLHWDELKHDNRFEELNREHVWAIAKLNRDLTARRIPLFGKLFFYTLTPEIERSLHVLDVKIGRRLGLEGEGPGIYLQKKFLASSLMEEAIASSQLEGAATSRLVAKKMLREKRKPRTNSERMIVNNYLTMMFIKEQVKGRPLTPELVLEIHKRITQGTLEKREYEGAFRTTNEIKVFAIDDPTQVLHEPPDYRLIDKHVASICAFVNSDTKDFYLHPIVKGIILHYLIGWVHPFNDGNGRTARALFYWYLISQGYDFFEYIAVSRTIKNAPSQYVRAYLFTESDANDMTYFVKFNLRAIDLAVKAFEAYLEKKKIENRQMLDTIRNNPRLNLRQADVLLYLNKSGSPISITEMQERYRITYETARSDLLELFEQGYVQKIKRGKQFLFLADRDRVTTKTSHP